MFSPVHRCRLVGFANETRTQKKKKIRFVLQDKNHRDEKKNIYTGEWIMNGLRVWQYCGCKSYESNQIHFGDVDLKKNTNIKLNLCLKYDRA